MKNDIKIERLNIAAFGKLCEKDIALDCYEFISAKSKAEQEHIYKILLEMDKYKGN